VVSTPNLVRLDFTRAFILDVDWFTHEVGAILAYREGKNEKVITYASKGFSFVQKKFHLIEGECYALVWGIMYFR
jgi:hypothetical protein